ncbi:hypothetical protein LZ31DRAFT_608540, partial [Colletotrichum somersetense]
LAREATIHCGSLSAKWSALRTLDDVTGDPTWWQYPETHKTWITGLRKAVFRISQFFIGLPEANRTIVNVLYPTSTLLSTDPRDKLFALMGVSNMSSLLKADYSKSTRDIYMDFTRRLIRRERNLEVLLTAGPWNPYNGLDIGLPFWTPDYRGISCVDIRYLAASHLGHFHASKDRKHSHIPSGSPSGESTLMVEGFIIDTVSETIFLGKGKSRRNTVMENFDPLGRPARPRARPFFKAFFETMILYNTTMYGESAGAITAIQKENKSRLELGFIHDFDEFYRMKNSAKGTQMDTMSFKSILETDTFEGAVREYRGLQKTEPDILHWRREEYTTRVEAATDGSLTNIFSTVDGYLGRGLSSVMEGDIVAVLFGSRLPFVLRKMEESPAYQLVSPCYVAGVMSGELMERVRRSGEESWNQAKIKRSSKSWSRMGSRGENSGKSKHGYLKAETLILV